MTGEGAEVEVSLLSGERNYKSTDWASSGSRFPALHLQGPSQAHSYRVTCDVGGQHHLRCSVHALPSPCEKEQGAG